VQGVELRLVAFAEEIGMMRTTGQLVRVDAAVPIDQTPSPTIFASAGLSVSAGQPFVKTYHSRNAGDCQHKVRSPSRFCGDPAITQTPDIRHKDCHG